MKALAIFCFAALTVLTFAANSFVAPTTATNLLSGQASGAELFKSNCAKCHGAEGTGGKGPNLTTEKKQEKWKDSDEKIVAKITNGAWGMPAFDKKLKPEEIKAIAEYVRSFKPQSK